MRINTSYQSAQKSDECTQTGILSQEVRNPRMWSGFTLIELLVCIAVIALIAAILFPTFMQARERGRKTVCLSNEKQIVQALQLYTQDHDETLPYWDAAYLTYPTLPEKISTLWKTSVQPYLKSGNPAGYVSKGKVYPETGVWRCPSIDAWKDGLGFSGTPHPPVPPTRPATASYGMSMYIAYDYFGPAPARGRTRYRPGLPLSMLRTPSNTVIFLNYNIDV